MTEEEKRQHLIDILVDYVQDCDNSALFRFAENEFDLGIAVTCIKRIETMPLYQLLSAAQYYCGYEESVC